MLPLDHIPFYSPDPEALADGFARLGFTLSPPSRYTAPDHPDAAWRGRCVFTRDGWFDVLFGERPRTPGAPMSVLFRTPDLAATRRELAALNPEEAFQLERGWADDDSLPRERFAYAGLRSRIAPLVLAVIQHAWPCVDLLPEWQDHANGAQAVTALIFGGEAPGPAAATAARFLDHQALEYWPQATFDDAFPGAQVRRAIRIRAADLAVTAAALAAAGARFAEMESGSLAVPPQFGVEAGLLFSA
jgi:hypothetical protein